MRLLTDQECIAIVVKLNEIVEEAGAAMALHELGHLAAARALGVRVRAVRISRKGMCVARESGTVAQNLVVSLAGPMINLALLLVPDGQFRLANLCLLVCNLAPIPNADGDRILRCLQTLWKRERAN